MEREKIEEMLFLAEKLGTPFFNTVEAVLLRKGLSASEGDRAFRKAERIVRLHEAELPMLRRQVAAESGKTT